MIRKILVAMIAIPGGLLGGLFGLVLLSVSYEPMMVKQSFSKDTYLRAEKWLGHMREAFEQDRLNRVTLDSGDISDLGYYAARRLKIGGNRVVTLEGIKTEFGDDTAITRLTLKLAGFEQLYLNLTLSFSERDGRPHWDFAQLGGSYWPGNILEWCLDHILLPLLPADKAEFWQVVTGAVEEFSIYSGKMSLVYRSDESLRQHLKAQAVALMLSSPEEKDVLQLYLDVISAAAAQQGGTQLSLADVLGTLFGLAHARSQDGSAVEENSRLLRAFALQVADAPVRALLAPGVKPASLDRPVVLRGRRDLSQHFLVSAALALTLDEETALDIGISKEHADSRAGGSGFSLADLVADMAGIRFAEAATRNEQQARKVQALMLARQGEQVFMPMVNWLPPGMSAEAYEDLVRHPLYPAMLDKIIKRLNSLPVHSEI